MASDDQYSSLLSGMLGQPGILGAQVQRQQTNLAKEQARSYAQVSQAQRNAMAGLRNVGACMGTAIYFCYTTYFSLDPGDINHAYNFNHTGIDEKEQRESEVKAVNLISSFLPNSQREVYEKTRRVIICKNVFFWIVGDVFESFNKDIPFMRKPDVIRIDNLKKRHITNFCVEQCGGDPTPYTDKVLAFITHLANDEKSFVKTVNRIGEKTLKQIPESAIWNKQTLEKMIQSKKGFK